MSEPSYLKEIPFDIVKEVALKLDYDDIVKIEDSHNFKFDNRFWRDYFEKHFSEVIIPDNYRQAVLANKTLLKDVRSGKHLKGEFFDKIVKKGYEKLLYQLNLTKKNCNNMIEYVISVNQPHIVKYFLSCADLEPELVNEYYFSATDLDIIKLLEDTNMITPETRDRFLIIAAHLGDLDIVKYLVDKNVDVKFHNSIAITIADAYARDKPNNKYSQIVKFLLQNGNDLSDIDEDLGNQMYLGIEG